MAAPAPDQTSSKFVVFQSLRGLLTLEHGTEYEIGQLRPHHTDCSRPEIPHLVRRIRGGEEHRPARPRQDHGKRLRQGRQRPGAPPGRKQRTSPCS